MQRLKGELSSLRKLKEDADIECLKKVNQNKKLRAKIKALKNEKRTLQNQVEILKKKSCGNESKPATTETPSSKKMKIKERKKGRVDLETMETQQPTKSIVKSAIKELKKNYSTLREESINLTKELKKERELREALSRKMHAIKSSNVPSTSVAAQLITNTKEEQSLHNNCTVQLVLSGSQKIKYLAEMLKMCQLNEGAAPLSIRSKIAVALTQYQGESTESLNFETICLFEALKSLLKYCCRSSRPRDVTSMKMCLSKCGKEAQLETKNRGQRSGSFDPPHPRAKALGKIILTVFSALMKRQWACSAFYRWKAAACGSVGAENNGKGAHASMHIYVPYSFFVSFVAPPSCFTYFIC